MKKPLIGFMIVFLMVCTASLASAKTSTPICQGGATCTGEVLFFDANGTVTATDITATLQLTEVPATDVPAVLSALDGRLYYGTFSFTLPTGTSVDMPITAIIGHDGKTYNISGTVDTVGTFQGQGLYTTTKIKVGKKTVTVPVVELGGNLNSTATGAWVGSIGAGFVSE
jgi:hypothetical protein